MLLVKRVISDENNENNENNAYNFSDTTKFYIPNMSEYTQDYSALNSVHQLMHSHKIIPKHVTPEEMYEDFKIDVIEDKHIHNNLKNIYDMDISKSEQKEKEEFTSEEIEKELGWKPRETFETGIRKTVEWYLSNQDWVNHVVSGEYKHWVKKQYA